MNRFFILIDLEDPTIVDCLVYDLYSSIDLFRPFESFGLNDVRPLIPENYV